MNNWLLTILIRTTSTIKSQSCWYGTSLKQHKLQAAHVHENAVYKLQDKGIDIAIPAKLEKPSRS